MPTNQAYCPSSFDHSEGHDKTRDEESGEALPASLPRPHGRRTLLEFFNNIYHGEQQAQTERQFAALTHQFKERTKRLRAQRRKMCRHETTFGLHTQNVMGLTKTPGNLDAWFNHFRQRDGLGARDVVFLQETHVEDYEIAKMTALHSRSWGFDPTQPDGTFSLWSASQGRKGGVAILKNPYSVLGDLTPYLAEQWTAHWMAVTVDIHGDKVLLINVYAPRE
jgi:hypothetical protein